MFDGIVEGINNAIRSLLFAPLGALLQWLEDMVNIILNEIAGYDFINLSFINDCYEIAVMAALVLLPLKLVYEWIWLMIDNDIEKWSTKLHAILKIAVVIIATPPILNLSATAITGINDAILTGEVVSDGNKNTAIDAGKGFVSTVLVATTSLSDDEAKEFIIAYDQPGFDINTKIEDNYKYDFDFLMPMLVTLVVFLLVLFIGLQMAMRQVSVGFYKVLTPICSLSLTNKDNPTAFIVWRNSIIANYVMNTVQIFLLVFMFSIISQLSETATPLARLMFTIALILSIIFIPNTISAMIGGYNGGILESLQTIQNGMAISSTAMHGARTIANATKVGASKTGSGTAKAFNKAKDAKNAAPGALAKAAGKTLSATGSAKDRIVSGKEKLNNLDSAIKNKGTDAVATIASQGIKASTKQYASQVASGVRERATGFGSAKIDGAKNRIMREKNLADAHKAFKSDNTPIQRRSDIAKPNNNFRNNAEGTPTKHDTKANTLSADKPNIRSNNGNDIKTSLPNNDKPNIRDKDIRNNTSSNSNNNSQESTATQRNPMGQEFERKNVRSSSPKKNERQRIK